MARRLDATPSEEEDSGHRGIAESIKRLPDALRRKSGTVSYDEYERMLSDRPEKFSQDEVGYREADTDEPNCLGCIHFFRSKQRSVCEIFRPDPEEDVKMDWTCTFQTSDGKSYPYLGEENGA